MNTKLISYLLCTTFILIYSTIIFAQPRNLWVRYYGGPGYSWFSDVYATTDGGYVMTGGEFRIGIHPDSLHGERQDVWIVKVDVDGALQWQNTFDMFNGGFDDRGKSIIETEGGDYLIGGATARDGMNYDFIAVKVDSEQEGDLIWERRYNGDDPGWCYAVIETKDGHYLLGGWIGRGRNSTGFAVMIDDDGEVVWEQRYERDQLAVIRAIREHPEGGYFLAGGADRSFSLMNIDDEGEVIWSRLYPSDNGSGSARSLVSMPGGYALAGGAGGDFRLVVVDEEGRQIWDRVYDIDGSQICYCLNRMRDNGFTLVGESVIDGDIQSFVLRTEPGGNIAWERLDDFFIHGWYYSSIIDAHGFLIAAGMGANREHRRDHGVLVKIVPERSAPVITDFTPENLDLSVLLDDSLFFSVSAVDLQEDSLSYLWTQNGDSISSDTSTVIAFDELGIDTVQCTVSDSALSDSIRWIVHVEEMYIDSYSPQNLTLSIRRNNAINFFVTTRALEDNPVEYLWLLNDEQIAENDSVSIRFERGREHSVTAVASQGELADSVTWQVMVNDLIVDYMPEQLELSFEVDTTFEFEVFPFDPEDDSLHFLWTLDGDSISDNSWVLVNFDSERLYNVTAYVSDTTESDSLTWTINVTPVGVHSNEPRHPDTPTLFPPVPNPFNSVTTVRYYLPTTLQVRLSLFDVNGRLVAELVDGYRTAGEHNYALRANELSSGLYFLSLQIEGQIETRKVLLIR